MSEKGIVEALQAHNLRVSAGGGHWLVWDDVYDKWVVYDYRGRKTIVTCRTRIEFVAVRTLLQEDE